MIAKVEAEQAALQQKLENEAIPDVEASEAFDAGKEMFAYFEQMAQDRLARPRDDLASALTHAAIDGQSLPNYELLSYFFLLVVAGNR